MVNEGRKKGGRKGGATCAVVNGAVSRRGSGGCVLYCGRSWRLEVPCFGGDGSLVAALRGFRYFRRTMSHWKQSMLSLLLIVRPLHKRNIRLPYKSAA